MFDIHNNYAISLKSAAEGFVLLKNEDNVLPFKANDKVAVVGKNSIKIEKSGGGTARVKCEYETNLVEALSKKDASGKIDFNLASVKIAEEMEEYDIPTLNNLAKESDKFIVAYKRYGTEGADRLLGEKPDMSKTDIPQEVLDYQDKTGYFYPSNREIDLFEKIEKSDIKEVVLLLNISDFVDISFIKDYSKIKAVLVVYMPGMEYGNAIADVLCGDVNPSGRLVDTVAYNYDDYPSSETFDKDKFKTEYTEGIFVGYRYFETFAKEKVMYPFGFGLSYTQFEFTNYNFISDDENITVSVDVTNIGEREGKEVAQVYISAPSGKLEKPFIELKAFAKTKLLKPGETQTLKMKFKVSDMASFDHTDATGYIGAWVLEAGEYEIFVGKSAREIYSCGKYNISETIVTEQLSIRFDGREYVQETNKFTNELFEQKENLSIYDVSEGKMTLCDFVNQLTPRELNSLALGKPIMAPEFMSGTGNMRKYDMPNPQTCDGSTGIRRSINATCFPCATILACTWDEEIQYEVGRSIGVEGYQTGVDILLGPAMNIHRHPRCGRNFEYFSEDPVVSGKAAAAFTRGLQSEGLCATLKHFAANNYDTYRHINNSIVDERTLREIYLKGFEIAVKEGDPVYIMSAYNLLNGKHLSEHAQLLRGVLRDEWKFEGAVMTDWRTGVPLRNEIIGGNNIKMPFGYPDEEEDAYKAYENGEISLSMLRENAFYVLNSLMKTKSFKQKDFGIIHKLSGEKTEIPVMQMNGLSCTRISHTTREDGKEYLLNLSLDQRDQRSYIYYMVDAECAGDYKISAEISTNCPETQIWFYDEDDNKTGTACCHIATDKNKWYTVDARISLKEGQNLIKLVFANEPYYDHDFFSPHTEIPNDWSELPEEDIKLAGLTIEKI